VPVRLLALIVTMGLAAVAQQNPEPVKHVMVAPQSGTANGQATVSARSVERGVGYPAVIRLKGDVEIRTPVCFKAGKGTDETVCHGYTIVRADEAEYDEATGEIQAHGKVTVVPLQTKK
jgi:hypothetical protein